MINQAEIQALGPQPASTPHRTLDQLAAEAASRPRSRARSRGPRVRTYRDSVAARDRRRTRWPRPSGRPRSTAIRTTRASASRPEDQIGIDTANAELRRAQERVDAKVEHSIGRRPSGAARATTAGALGGRIDYQRIADESFVRERSTAPTDEMATLADQLLTVSNARQTWWPAAATHGPPDREFRRPAPERPLAFLADADEPRPGRRPAPQRT
jgi:hypothetical protein